MKIVIFGSTGFIGSNLVELFRSKEIEVSTLCRLEFLNEEKILDVVADSDVIINCIGSASVGFSYSNTENDFESNVHVVRRVLEIMRTHNLNYIKFINLSSAAVYGNPKRLPVREADNAQPLSPYGYHKLMSEFLIREYSECFGLKALSLRVFSAYGNGQKKLLLWDLHQKIQNSKDKIILFGSGNESRDFIHIEDIFQQIFLTITNADFNGEALNVANGEEVKISKILALYKKHYPKRFNHIFNGEVRLGDPLNWCADISTMINWGYKQSVLIDCGVEKYIEYIISGKEKNIRNIV